MKLDIDAEWLLQKAEQENGCCITAIGKEFAETLWGPMPLFMEEEGESKQENGVQGELDAAELIRTAKYIANGGLWTL